MHFHFCYNYVPVVGCNRQIVLVEQAHKVSATAIVKGPVSKGTLEDFDAEIGIAGKVSPCKLNEGSEDTQRQEKVQLE